MTPAELFQHAERLDDAAIDEIHRWATTRPWEILAVAGAARASFAVMPSDRQLSTLPFEHRAAIAGLCSLHRNGYVREAALRTLASIPSAMAVPFLLLRCDDVVPPVREQAVAAVRACMRADLAPAFARSLRIIDALAGRQRGSSLIEDLRHFLIANPAALDAVSDDPDALVRQRAREWRIHAGDFRETMAKSLVDPSIRVQLWAARLIVSKRTSDADKLALLPLLERSRLVSARLLGLRARAQVDLADEPLERALLDHQAAVRHLARTLLRARHPDRPFGDTRGRALAVLRREATPDEIVGALGALADIGLLADVGLIDGYANDARRRVRREATRTLGVLKA